MRQDLSFNITYMLATNVVYVSTVFVPTLSSIVMLGKLSWLSEQQWVKILQPLKNGCGKNPPDRLFLALDIYD